MKEETERRSKPGYEKAYWCCAADFGSHESDCPNFEPVAPAPTASDHAAEIERLSKERDEWEHRHNDAVMDLSNRLEAAESKLSQLQLVLESDASGRPAHLLLWEAAQALDKQGSGPLVDCLKIMSSQLEQLAILNGGQQ